MRRRTAAAPAEMLRVKRIYEPPAPGDGQRFLVERLWARGVSREAARLAGWLKELAPSPGLRTWFGHDPARWAEFRRRYRAELRAPEKQELLRRLAAAARAGPVTLVYAARDTEHNSAVLLKEVLEERYLRQSSPARRAQRARRGSARPAS